MFTAHGSEDCELVCRALTGPPTPIRVVITEASSYIARSLAYRILQEHVFGYDRQVIISFYDATDTVSFLESVAFEISACGPNLLKTIECSTDPAVAFKDADIVFSIGKTRDYTFSRVDLRSDPFYQNSIAETMSDAKAIETYAKKTALVITLGNCAASVISTFAPSIPKENITGLSLVLLKRASYMISQKTGKKPSDVRNLIIWGTNSRHAFPDLGHAKFVDGKSVLEVIDDDVWCKTVLTTIVEDAFRKCRYRISEALALAEHCKLLMQGTPEGEWTCMSVYSDGSYGVTPGVFYSFPVYCINGKWEIVQGLRLDNYCTRMIKDIVNVVERKVQLAIKMCREMSEQKTERKESVRKSIIKRPSDSAQQNNSYPSSDSSSKSRDTTPVRNISIVDYPPSSLLMLNAQMAESHK